MKSGTKAAKGMYFLKSRPAKITEDNIDATVACREIEKNILKHLECVLENVYVPLLANPKNHVGWGEVVSKEVMDKVYGLLASITITVGQINGQTTLPLPLMDKTEQSANNKERIYLLESAIITWTKQIRNVLKKDPELLLKQVFVIKL